MATSPIEDLAGQSQFIFRGTLERIGDATMSDVPITDATAIVKIEEVFLAPRVLGELTGQNITVVLREAGDQGRRAVFFTEPWLYGDSVAVREIGRLDLRPAAGEAEASQLRQQVSDMLERKPDEELRQHLREVEVVVVGRVVNAGPLDVRGQLPTTEHDPQWWEVVISAEIVVKGEVSSPTVSVAFASSMDVMWARAPKLVVGQDGVWLLHRGPATGKPPEEYPAPLRAAYVVIHPLDAHPRAAEDRIRRLVQGITGGPPSTR